jgi:O-antigen ligase
MTTILIGVGTGGFLSVLGLWDNPLGAWPHNIFLEILFENGVIGLFAFVLLTKSVLRRMRELLGRRGEISPEICIGCGLVLFMMINALFSLDLNGNRMLFTSFGLIYAIRLLYRS